MHALDVKLVHREVATIRVVAGLALVCLLLDGAAAAEQGGIPEPEPTPLEVFATQADAHLTWSEEVGRIENGTAHAVIMAIIVENGRQAPGRMRGIRIDLENETATDRVYVEDTELVYLKSELDQMDADVAWMRTESGAVNRVRGTAQCWMPDPVLRYLCPAYYIRPDAEGLSLSTFAGPSFQFPDARPSQLATAISKAMTRFGLDETMPATERIELPAEALNKIIASAIHYFPELESSSGIKAANYRSRHDKRSASVIFWPYERRGDYAHSRLVYCDARGADENDWTCSQGEARGYLSIPEQEREVVIAGELSRDIAIALIAFAKGHLRDDPNYPKTVPWIVSIIVPDIGDGTRSITLTDGVSRNVSFTVKDVRGKQAGQFEIVEAWRS